MSATFIRTHLRFILTLVVFAAGSAFAAQPGNDTAQQQRSHQVMSPQYTEHMLQLMKEMRDNVAQMSDIMEKHQMMSQTNLSQAAQLISNMSNHMQEMSKRMQQGQFDDKSVALMQKRNQDMTRMMHSLQHELDTAQ